MTATPSEFPANELDISGEEAVYRTLRHFWHPVIYSPEVTDGPRQATLLDEQLVVVRLNESIRCFKDLCVRCGTALSLGSVQDNHLQCAYDGWTYDSDGTCISIPAYSSAEVPTRASLTTYKAEEHLGLIWVALVDDPHFPLPDDFVPDDPDYRLISFPAFEWECSGPRRLENYVDFSHFAWVHDGILGDRDHPEVPDHRVWRHGHELRFGEGFTSDSRGREQIPERGGLPYKSGVSLDNKRYRLFMPFSVLLDQTLADDRVYQLFFAASPISRKRTMTFQLLGRNYELDDDSKFIERLAIVFEQDRPIVESQRPEELPYDLSAELHVKGADRVAVEYRRWLVELVDALGERVALKGERDGASG